MLTIKQIFESKHDKDFVILFIFVHYRRLQILILVVAHPDVQVVEKEYMRSYSLCGAQHLLQAAQTPVR